MKKFRYTGNCEGMTFRHVEFPIDKAVEIEDEEMIAKLEGNSHFSEVKSRTKKATDNGDSSGNTE